MKLGVGIDWGDEHHAICLRELDTRRIVAELVIEHNAQGVTRFEDSIVALRCAPDECLVAVETNQGLLVNYLAEAGYQVRPIPPAALVAYRRRRRQSNAKSDGDDARLLADMICQDRDLYPALVSDSPLARKIRVVYRGRAQLLRLRTQVISQLKQTLKSCFPLAIDLFSSLDTCIAQAFLKTFPTQRAAHMASKEELRTFFGEHSYRQDRVDGLIEMLHRPAVPVPPWQAESGALLTGILLDQLAALSEHMGLLEAELEALLALHPDAPIFRSLPRVGTILAAGLIGELGDCRDKFEAASGLQALAGTAPVTVQSGSSRRVCFRFACNKPLRHVFQQFARQSARTDGSAWARGYVANQLERGHSKSRAYRALANRWGSIIFRLWQSHALYDESYHLRNIAQRGVRQHIALSLAEVA